MTQKNDEPQCPVCGYTEIDAAIHMDHWRCKGIIPDMYQKGEKMTTSSEHVPVDDMFLAECKRLDAAATKDWNMDGNNPCDEHYAENYPADYEFVVFSRTAMLRLVAEVERQHDIAEQIMDIVTDRQYDPEPVDMQRIFELCEEMIIGRGKRGR